MRAAVYRTTGAARDVLRVEDVARPEPAPGEVLVRVRASGVNPTDFKTRAGATARPVDEFQIPHHDGAGVIEAVGAGVDPARVVEVALGANLALDLAVSGPSTVVVSYAADGPDPVLPVRACMTANVTLRFVLLYGVPAAALDAAVAGVTSALAVGALTELPAHRFALTEIAAAQEAAESGAVGKVIVIP
ncbi:MAG TPA: alcohol dehydrogenase catalytic domain-containing protein [Trebonia sp.]|jgi:NADPH2:quinone reductase